MLHELDARTRVDGLEVAILWDDEVDVVILRTIEVDPANLIPHAEVCKVPRNRAAHAFRHPALYMPRREPEPEEAAVAEEVG